MAHEILSFLLNVVAGLIGGACLLRLYMQHQRVPFGNPIGRFVFAVTDWIILPLRRVLPAVRRVDSASLVAAYLIQLAQYTVLWAVFGGGNYVPVLLMAFFGLLQLAVTALTALLIVYAVLSWVQNDSPLADVIDRLCAPILRPIRRVIPLVGGIDLSPLVLLVLLQVVSMVIRAAARSAL